MAIQNVLNAIKYSLNFSRLIHRHAIGNDIAPILVIIRPILMEPCAKKLE